MRRVSIETLQPAKVTIEGSKRNIAICASSTLLADAIAGNIEAKSIPADSLIENILFSLKYLLEKEPGYEDSKISVHTATPDKPFVNDPDFDILVHLEKLQIKNQYYGQQYGYPDFEWEAYIYMTYTAQWSLYRKGEKTDWYNDTDLIVITSNRYETKAEAVENLPEARDAWWDLGIVLAKNYVERITPQWRTGTRYIYMINRFPELSTLAYKAMGTDNYARAFDVWETMLLSCRKKGQKQAKSQIIYNMAVACEFQNDLEQAVDFTKQSVALKPKYVFSSYLKLLNSRQEHQSTLDRQIN
jgi:hypothetical protein